MIFPRRRGDFVTARAGSLWAATGPRLWQGLKRPSIRSAGLGLLLLGHLVLSGLSAAEEKELFEGIYPASSRLARRLAARGVFNRAFSSRSMRAWTTRAGGFIVGDAEDMASGIVVTAKLRLDTWKGDDQAPELAFAAIPKSLPG